MTELSMTREAPSSEQTDLPTFIIGGALKAGTTSLYYYLSQHPDIYMCPIKEPRYFAFEPSNPEHVANTNFFPVRTLDAYRALFHDAAPGALRGEASPHYMLSGQAPQLIHDTIPDVQLVFSLRHPIERAYSGYWHVFRMGQETRPVELALTEDDYLVTNGRYFAMLAPWYELFDESRIKLLFFDDLKVDAVGVVRELCQYLGVTADYEFDTTVRNQGGALRNERLGRVMERLKTHPIRKSLDPLIPSALKSTMLEARSRNFEAPPPLPDDVARRLQDYYADDIGNLEALTGRDLSAWRTYA